MCRQKMQFGKYFLIAINAASCRLEREWGVHRKELNKMKKNLILE